MVEPLRTKEKEMAFDESKDVLVKELGIVEADGLPISVALRQYNGGDVKVALLRTVERSDGSQSVSRLGRLTQKETEALLPLLEEAIEGFETAAAKPKKSKKTAKPKKTAAAERGTGATSRPRIAQRT